MIVDTCLKGTIALCPVLSRIMFETINFNSINVVWYFFIRELGQRNEKVIEYGSSKRAEAGNDFSSENLFYGLETLFSFVSTRSKFLACY